MTGMNDPARSNRREFLTGKAAVDALAARLAAEEANSPFAAPLPEETYLLHYSRRAMACEFELCLNAGQYPNANRAAIDALDLVDRLESQLTIYRDQSEVMEINRRAAHEPVPVEAGLFGLLELGLELWRQTGGAFDMTSGPLSRVWGFSRRAGRLPQPDELADALSCVGSQYLELDREHRTVRFHHPRLELNLGALGKGYALDCCGKQLREAGIENFLFHAGQSSILAAGGRGDAGYWEIGIGDPFRPTRRLGRLRIRDRAVGTSGSAYQFFRHGGKRYGHILDPRTGEPAQGVDAVTVLAPTAAEADALATAMFVLGPEGAKELCRQRPELAMVMVVSGCDGRPAQVETAGLTEGEWSITSESLTP